MATGLIQGPQPAMEVEDIILKASANRTAGDLVTIAVDAHGDFVDASLVSSATVFHHAVALENITAGSYGRYRKKGRVRLTVPSATYTDGHGLRVSGTTITSTGAAATYKGESDTNFAVIIEPGTGAVTSVIVNMLGKPCTQT